MHVNPFWSWPWWAQDRCGYWEYYQGSWPSGPNLPRQRKTWQKVTATVESWPGRDYGWLRLDRQTTAKLKCWDHGGRVYVHSQDIVGERPGIGSRVQCHVYRDVSGVGAEDVHLVMLDATSSPNAGEAVDENAVATSSPKNVNIGDDRPAFQGETQEEAATAESLGACCFALLPLEIDFFKYLGARQFSRLRVASSRLASYEVLLENLIADACREDVIINNYIITWSPVTCSVSNRRRPSNRKALVRDLAVVSAARSLRWLIRGLPQWHLHSTACLAKWQATLAALCGSEDPMAVKAAQCTAGKAERMWTLSTGKP
ncbi:unnamed protein product [Symbiodinium sp. CCMP2592]|nr:unnamed protein product [Symbiodinium sp. CCMP2592]